VCLTKCASGAGSCVGVARGARVVLGADTENDVLELAIGGGQVALGHHGGKPAEVAGGRVHSRVTRARQAIGGRCEEGNGGDESRDKHDDCLWRVGFRSEESKFWVVVES
jgi:hypothetical protein